MSDDTSRGTPRGLAAGSGRILSTATDYQSTLASFSQLVVDSGFADECIVEACVADGAAGRTGTAPADGPARSHGTGRLAAVEGGVLCVMRVPLVARGAVLGGMSLVRVGTREAYTDADREVAEALAWCAALVVDNAALAGEARAARVAAQKAAQLEQEFLSIASHELRTPITAVLGWARLLLNEELEPDRRRHAVEAIERNARAEAQLVQNLIDAGLLLAGDLGLRRAAMKPLDVVVRAIDAMGDAARARDVRVELAVPRDPGVVVGDAERLRQIVACLLSNAIKLTPSGGRVGVRLERTGTDLAITVEDDGALSDPGRVASVFDPLHPSELTTSPPGRGLALAIARRLVELHGGTLSASRAVPGRGARFVARVPAREAAVEPQLQPPADARARTRTSGVQRKLVPDEPVGGLTKRTTSRR